MADCGFIGVIYQVEKVVITKWSIGLCVELVRTFGT